MRDVITALVTALQAQDLTVYKGEAPTAAKAPYVIVYPPIPRPGDRSMGAKHKAARWRVPTMYVGTSADSVLWVAEKATAALQGQRLSVEGAACSPLVNSPQADVAPDPDDRSIFSALDTWTFTTTAA